MAGAELLAALPPFSPTALATRSTLDPVAATLILAATAGYLTGVRRLARRGRRWPASRTASFLAGVALLAVATQSGLAAYDTELFSVHVTQHVLLGVAAPLFLALSAPVTLALQACTRPTQVNLLRVLRSRAVRVVGHPVVAWGVFGATLFALYFSPLFELSLRNQVVHAWVHLHFVAAGCLFCWATVGTDPVAHRLPHAGRLLLVALTVPVHAFLGIALLTATRPLGEAALTGLSGTAALDDQRTGAAIMWIVSDVIGLVLGWIVARQWWQAEQRRTRRLDALLDAQEAAASAGAVSPVAGSAAAAAAVCAPAVGVSGVGVSGVGAARSVGPAAG